MKNRMHIPTVADAPVASKKTLEMIGSQLGFVPNLQRLMGNSPVVLNGWFDLFTTFGALLDLKTRTGIALAVSEVNGCSYCLSVHHYTAINMAKMDKAEIVLNRTGESGDPKRAAAIHFARQVVGKRGKVSNEEFLAVKKAGYSDKEIIEIVGLSVLFLMTNFMNNVNDTQVDLPEVVEPNPLNAFYADPNGDGQGYNAYITCGVGG